MFSYKATIVRKGEKMNIRFANTHNSITSFISYGEWKLKGMKDDMYHLERRINNRPSELKITFKNDILKIVDIN